MTMKAAQDMARLRWQGKSKEEKLETGQMLAESRQAIDPERRSAIAKKAAAARWAGVKKKAAPKKAVKKAAKRKEAK